MFFHPQAEACGKGMVAQRVVLPIAAWLQPAVGKDTNTLLKSKEPSARSI